MCLLSNFGCKIIFMCSVNFWQQQDSNSLFKGSIGHVTSECKWPVLVVLVVDFSMGRLHKRQLPDLHFINMCDKINLPYIFGVCLLWTWQLVPFFLAGVKYSTGLQTFSYNLISKLKAETQISPFKVSPPLKLFLTPPPIHPSRKVVSVPPKAWLTHPIFLIDHSEISKSDQFKWSYH